MLGVITKLVFAGMNTSLNKWLATFPSLKTCTATSVDDYRSALLTLTMDAWHFGSVLMEEDVGY